MFEILGTVNGTKSWVGWNERGFFYGPLGPFATLRVGDSTPVMLTPGYKVAPSETDPLGAYAAAASLFDSVDLVNGDEPEMEEGDVLDNVTFEDDSSEGEKAVIPHHWDPEAHPRDPRTGEFIDLSALPDDLPVPEAITLFSQLPSAPPPPKFTDHRATLRDIPKPTTDPVVEQCPRCLGTGRFSFHAAYGDVCFGCRGTGKVEVKASTWRNRKLRMEQESYDWYAEAVPRLRASAEGGNRHESNQEHLLDVMRAAHPLLHQMMDDASDGGYAIANSLAPQFVNKPLGELTDADFAEIARRAQEWADSRSKSTVQVRPYMRDGHPVVGYDREQQAGDNVRALTLEAAEKWLRQGEASHRMLLWHGTPSPDKVREMGLIFAEGVGQGDGPVIWLSDSRQHAEGYGEPVRVAAKFRKLLFVTHHAHSDRSMDFEEALKREGVDVAKYPHMSRGPIANPAAVARAEGFDGIAVKLPDTVYGPEVPEHLRVSKGTLIVTAFDLDSLRVILDAGEDKDAKATVKDVVTVRPYVRDGHPVAGYTRHTTKLVSSAAEAAGHIADGNIATWERDLRQRGHEILQMQPGDSLHIAGASIYRLKADYARQAGWPETAWSVSHGGRSGNIGTFFDASEIADAIRKTFPESREIMVANWKKRLRGKLVNKRSDSETWSELEHAVGANEGNKTWQSFMERTNLPDTVLPWNEDGLRSIGMDVLTSATRNVSEHTTALNADSVKTLIRMKKDPRLTEVLSRSDFGPGVTGTGMRDTAAVLRHEYAHSVWQVMDEGDRQAFLDLLPKQGDGYDEKRIAAELTTYAAIGEFSQHESGVYKTTPHGYRTETFSEGVAVVTDPRYKRDEWAPWLGQVADLIDKLEVAP